MVAELRQAGLRAEVYLGNPKNFGNQLKYADKRDSPVAIIEGGDEKARGVVQIKDLILGKKIAESATAAEWADRPQQFEVPRDRMLAKVREIIASHE
ncbi:MAG: His/Gly/Thr/Pro-type tRNA ligase C-terminal domain-containing protein, partial [Paracoccaceae bacterium]